MKWPRNLSAFVALACITACSGPSGLTAVRTQELSGPSSERSGSLTFKVFTAGRTPGFPAEAVAVDLAPGAGGYMWFTDWNTPAIGRIAPDGTVTEFTNGLLPEARPYSVVAGEHGGMWFSDERGLAIGDVTPDGTISEHDARHLTKSRAMGIAVDSQGVPWVVGFGLKPMLGHLTARGTVAPEPLPAGIRPDDALTSDSHGSLWFLARTETTRANLVERTARGNYRRRKMKMRGIALPCCPNHAAKSIGIDPDGNPWFTALDFGHDHSPVYYLGTLQAGKIRLIQISRKGLSGFPYPSGLAATAGGLWITGGNPFADDGALWHVNYRGKQIGYDLPYNPLSVAVDTEGHPWFTASFFGEPSRIVKVNNVP